MSLPEGSLMRAGGIVLVIFLEKPQELIQSEVMLYGCGWASIVAYNIGATSMAWYGAFFYFLSLIIVGLIVVKIAKNTWKLLRVLCRVSMRRDTNLKVGGGGQWSHQKTQHYNYIILKKKEY